MVAPSWTTDTRTWPHEGHRGRVKPELRSSGARAGVGHTVRHGKIRISKANVSAGTEWLRADFPASGLGGCDTLLLHERVHQHDMSYCMLAK